MESTIDRTRPYPIRVPHQQSAGELHVGWRSYPVNVVDISWQEITLALPNKAAKRIRQHSKATIWNQGNQWRGIIVDSPQRHQNGVATVILHLSDEDDPRIKRILKSAGGYGASIGEQRIGADPVVIATVLVGMIIAFMVAPGWGERMGTSDTLTRVFIELFSSFWDFVSNLF